MFKTIAEAKREYLLVQTAKQVAAGQKFSDAAFEMLGVSKLEVMQVVERKLTK
jgi:hypothetical protein